MPVKNYLSCVPSIKKYLTKQVILLGVITEPATVDLNLHSLTKY